MDRNSEQLWTEFLTEVERAKSSVHASRSGAWFRGHRNASWELKPSLLRFSNGLAREESLFVEFKNRGAALIGDTSKENIGPNATLRRPYPTVGLDRAIFGGYVFCAFRTFGAALLVDSKSLFAVRESYESKC